MTKFITVKRPKEARIASLEELYEQLRHEHRQLLEKTSDKAEQAGDHFVRSTEVLCARIYINCLLIRETDGDEEMRRYIGEQILPSLGRFKEG